MGEAEAGLPARVAPVTAATATAAKAARRRGETEDAAVGDLRIYVPFRDDVYATIELRGGPAAPPRRPCGGGCLRKHGGAGIVAPGQVIVKVSHM
ncbi:hypothetical protein QF032_002625 [Streptomyces achromogenes]|nr:hypothetical protein [Streptomyces achromogenes]